MLPVLEDNFIFIVSNDETKKAIVVDPAVEEPVTAFLLEKNFDLVAVLNTHHHSDHTGANLKLAAKWNGLKIYGSAHDSKRIPGLTKGFVNLENFRLLGQEFVVFETSGHTLGHIVFAMNPDSSRPEIFVGDTVFGGGCGKLFEGTFEQMFHSLQKIRKFSTDSRIWCAHEYTEKNFSVAIQLEPENEGLKDYYKQIQALRGEGKFTVPLLLETELKYNPFLRWDSRRLKAATRTKEDIETFTFVRKFRDQF